MWLILQYARVSSLWKILGAGRSAFGWTWSTLWLTLQVSVAEEKKCDREAAKTKNSSFWEAKRGYCPVKINTIWHWCCMCACTVLMHAELQIRWEISAIKWHICFVWLVSSPAVVCNLSRSLVFDYMQTLLLSFYIWYVSLVCFFSSGGVELQPCQTFYCLLPKFQHRWIFFSFLSLLIAPPLRNFYHSLH